MAIEKITVLVPTARLVGRAVWSDRREKLLHDDTPYRYAERLAYRIRAIAGEPAAQRPTILETA